MICKCFVFFFFYQMMIKKLQVLSMLSALNFAVIDRQKIVIWEATRTVLDTGGQILKKLWQFASVEGITR